MHAQLDSKVMCKGPKKKKKHLIFMKFGVKKFTLKSEESNCCMAN
jgi:hypothetical protein